MGMTIKAEFVLVKGFTIHVYTRLGSKSNYSATANLHESQIITASSKPFPPCYALTNSSQETASNKWKFSFMLSGSIFTTSNAELPLLTKLQNSRL
jgi:hypothetical protein